MPAKKQFKKTDPEFQRIPEDNASSLFKFAKEKFGVELLIDQDDRKPSAVKPSGKGSSSFRGSARRGNTKFLDCYSMDIAPMNIFENQCIPVGIHNLSKFFCPNLNTIRVLSLRTKFIPKWDTTTTRKTKDSLNNFAGTLGLLLICFLKKTEEKQNLSNKEKRSLNMLIKNRNVKICVNDADKNLGPISADKSDVILNAIDTCMTL